MTDSVRIDKWLWAARFYKTRRLATAAVQGGKVQLNGVRVKPARPVKVNDVLVIHKADKAWEITVNGLSERRGSARIAQSLYTESAASIEARRQLSEQHKLLAATMPHPQRRPDKKARRQLRESKWRNAE